MFTGLQAKLKLLVAVGAILLITIWVISFFGGDAAIQSFAEICLYVVYTSMIIGILLGFGGLFVARLLRDKASLIRFGMVAGGVVVVFLFSISSAEGEGLVWWANAGVTFALAAIILGSIGAAVAELIKLVK